MPASAKRQESTPLGRPRLLKEMVAITAQTQQIERTLELVRERIERDAELRVIRLATVGAALDAAELSGRLAKMLVAIEEEDA